jgi:DNA helicase II / ATP-dependent DNA helicase PcrA
MDSNTKAAIPKKATVKQTQSKPAPIVQNDTEWSVGDRVMHRQFGEGQITNVFGSGSKATLAIRFDNLTGMKRKILPIGDRGLSAID